MAQIQVRDQNGAPVGGIAINLGRRDEPGHRLFTQVVDKAGNTDFGYAAAGIVALNALPADQTWILYVNDVEAFNDNWKNIEQRDVNVDNFSSDTMIVLQVHSSQPPVPVNPGPNGTSAEWKAVIFPKLLATGPYVKRDSLWGLKDWLNSMGVLIQNQERGMAGIRPRLHCPVPPGHDIYEKSVDLGDWYGEGGPNQTWQWAPVPPWS